ncbi:hypothetical protein EVAR_63826_1 [Eumeta japonica]|uniref:Uncharacterized protein n=1 Tax=Eumeta variegata TaxID=151549 RepID=A0A4C1ZMQ4_EUMVA|nr:hypothetical protein EVAR_63826_1 [Eumeta japonica]
MESYDNGQSACGSGQRSASSGYCEVSCRGALNYSWKSHGAETLTKCILLYVTINFAHVLSSDVGKRTPSNNV